MNTKCDAPKLNYILDRPSHKKLNGPNVNNAEADNH